MERALDNLTEVERERVLYNLKSGIEGSYESRWAKAREFLVENYGNEAVIEVENRQQAKLDKENEEAMEKQRIEDIMWVETLEEAQAKVGKKDGDGNEKGVFDL